MPKYRTRTPPETASSNTSPTKNVPKEILRDGEELRVHFGLPTEPSPPELPPGFSIELKAFPVDGRLVALPPDGNDDRSK